MRDLLPALLLIAAASASAQTFEEKSFADAVAAARSARPAAAVVDPKARGSWFRKVSSPEGVDFDGITGWGVLPRPRFDADRIHAPVVGESAFTAGPLDSPALYLGAHAEGREVDAGLKWDHVYDKNGSDTGRFAWRVFWRVASPSGNQWSNPAPGSGSDVYLKPGDRFAMRLSVRPDGTARLDVRGTSGPAMTQVLALDGFWSGAKPLPRSFKRVHAIDQFTTAADGRRVGLEGRAALPTRAALDDGRWEGVHLLGASGRAPLTGGLAVEVRGPDEADGYGRVFPGASPDSSGGEEIVVTPPQP